MKVSIVIPYYKRRRYIFKALKQLVNQTFPKDQFEVILVNDGSDDLTWHDIEALNLEIDIHYFEIENQGAARARNRGAERAKGEILIFLDSEQFVKPDFIEQHIRFFGNLETPERALQITTRSCVRSGFENDLDRMENYVILHDVRHEFFQLFSYNLANLRCAWHLVYSHNISLYNQAIKTYGAFDEGFEGWGMEDIEFGYRLQKNGFQIYYNPNIEAYDQDIKLMLKPITQQQFLDWERNTKYFIEKYYELPVLLQWALRESYNPETRQKVGPEQLQQVWITAMTKFEQTLRHWEGMPFSLMQETRVIRDPTIKDLKKVLETFPQQPVQVIAKKQNLPLICWVQENTQNDCVQLYFV